MPLSFKGYKTKQRNIISSSGLRKKTKNYTEVAIQSLHATLWKGSSSATLVAVDDIQPSLGILAFAVFSKILS